MSTPASFNQVNKFVKVGLGDPDSDQMQYILANAKYFKALARADFLKIDFDAFTKSLTPTHAPIAWRPVSEYAGKIADWNQLRGWGLTIAQITTFAATLVDHLGPLHPTGIKMWLGRDLSFNWEEVMACLKLEVEALDETFKPYIESNQLSFFPGSEQSGELKLTVALLDLQTYWNPTDGVVTSQVRKIEKRLPGLEVAWLLALNAPVYLAIDYKTIPGLVAAGLVVDYNGVLFFGHVSDEAYLDDLSAKGRLYCFSEVRFRE